MGEVAGRCTGCRRRGGRSAVSLVALRFRHGDRCFPADDTRPGWPFLVPLGDLDIELAADRGVTIDAAMTGRSGSAVSPDDILDAPSPWASVGTSTGEPGFAVLGIARWMRRSETEPRGGDRLDVNGGGPLLRIEADQGAVRLRMPEGAGGH